MTSPQNQITPIHIYRRSVSRRDALDARKRLRSLEKGAGSVLRFSWMRRFEHVVLMVTFMALALTGLLRAFDEYEIAQRLLILLGGPEQARSWHYTFALPLGALAILHLVGLAERTLIKRQPAHMLPGVTDLRQAINVLKLNLGLTRRLPLYDRYTFEEKFVYWVTVLSVLTLGLTGVVMWFPGLVSQVLPGIVYPYAVLLHRWVAIFATAVLLLAHTYQVLLRKRNGSIFTGVMTAGEMEEAHPVELEYLKQAARLADSKTWPQQVEFSLEERYLGDTAAHAKKHTIKETTSSTLEAPGSESAVSGHGNGDK